MIPHSEKAADAVQVRHATLHGIFGSGRLVGPDLVLTARHVLTRQGEPPKEGWRIAVWSEVGLSGQGFLAAEVAWCDATAEPDIALLRLLPRDGRQREPRLCPMWGRITSGLPEKAWAVGFPAVSAAARFPSDRPDYLLHGLVQLPTARLPAYRFKATFALDAADRSRASDLWRGMSGAAVFVGRTLIGVMQEVPKDWMPGEYLDVAAISGVATASLFARPVCGADQLDLKDAVPEERLTTIPVVPAFGFGRCELPIAFLHALRSVSELAVRGGEHKLCAEFVNDLGTVFRIEPSEVLDLADRLQADDLISIHWGGEVRMTPAGRVRVGEGAVSLNGVAGDLAAAVTMLSEYRAGTAMAEAEEDARSLGVSLLATLEGIQHAEPDLDGLKAALKRCRALIQQLTPLSNGAVPLRLALQLARPAIGAVSSRVGIPG
jgi:hypothetical protein